MIGASNTAVWPHVGQTNGRGGNVTVDQTEGRGYLTVWGPFGEDGGPPNTSNLNWFTDNQIAANLVVTRLGSDAGVFITAGGGGRARVIVDVLGYFV